VRTHAPPRSAAIHWGRACRRRATITMAPPLYLDPDELAIKRPRPSGMPGDRDAIGEDRRPGRPNRSRRDVSLPSLRRIVAPLREGGSFSPHPMVLTSRSGDGFAASHCKNQF